MTKSVLILMILVFTSCGKGKGLDKPEDVENASEVGPTGPTGPTGPVGKDGVAGRDANYVPSDLSATSPSGNLTMAAAATYCRDLVESGHDDWHLPTIEELAPFFGIDSNSNYVWTRTPSASTSIYFVLARMDTGQISADVNPGGKYARCVR